MNVVISLLRAVNLGAHNRIKMDALCGLYESLDLREPKSYVQSGNVVFKTRERDVVRLARRIEKGIEDTFGFHTDVVLRTAADLRDVLARNPFRARPEIHPGKLLVLFLAGEPGEKARENVRRIKTDPEELWIDGREVYMYFPNGMGRSKLPWTRLDKMLETAGTARNWNSVTKLLQMAEKMEQS
ncbi:MAG TPA: DUF1697 domain-containing protein [Bryobacteraceae bacterium]|jgi:uncharacterized protein (DUF1697 family)